MLTRRPLLFLSLAAALMLTAPGCRSKRSTDAKTDHAVAKLRGRPKTLAELPTTDASIYLGNLDGQISELERLVRERPNITANVQRLSTTRYVRGRFRDDVDEIQAAIDDATRCIGLQPEDPACWLVRAEQEQSLHRFKEARADVEHARTLRGADRSRIAAAEADLDWNDGAYDKAIAAIRKARHDRPSTSTWMREAQLEHDLGHDEEADKGFETAEDAISDTAPLAVAHLDVQRGIQKVDQGRLDEAVVFFREAAARMPTYIAANEHLAETLGMMGKDDEAIAIYEKVVALSNDPEFAHALGELYAKKGKTAEAKALDEKARARYGELLERYPEAMYWHASEFFMSIGDVKRALTLLQQNIVLRPNATSHVALARAQLADGQLGEARTTIDKALAMPVRSAMLFWTASRVYRAGGDDARADAFRDQAKQLNPRIDATP